MSCGFCGGTLGHDSQCPAAIVSDYRRRFLAEDTPVNLEYGKLRSQFRLIKYIDFTKPEEPPRRWYDWPLDHPGVSYLILFAILGVVLAGLLYFNPGNWKEWK
jgi:hypothetical protein